MDLSSSFPACTPFQFLSLFGPPGKDVPLLEAQQQDSGGETNDPPGILSADAAQTSEQPPQEHPEIQELGSIRIAPTPEKKVDRYEKQSVAQ